MIDLVVTPGQPGVTVFLPAASRGARFLAYASEQAPQSPEIALPLGANKIVEKSEKSGKTLDEVERHDI